MCSIILRGGGTAEWIGGRSVRTALVAQWTGSGTTNSPVGVVGRLEERVEEGASTITRMLGSGVLWGRLVLATLCTGPWNMAGVTGWMYQIICDGHFWKV
jgi:hypothetical protein